MSAAIFVAGFTGVLGLAIGSFLNVVAYRVPAGISLLRESRCPACGDRVAWRNIPVLGWLLLGGKCAHCRAKISVRYPLVEAVTGLGFAGVTILWWQRLPSQDNPAVADWIVLAAFLGFLAVGIVLALIDLDTQRLPNVIVLPSIVVAAALLTLAAGLGGAWEQFGRAMAGAAILWAFYGLVRFVRPDGMGGGDVKLAALVGLFLGWVGWGALAVGGFAAFVLGGVFGMLLIARSGGSRHASPGGSTVVPEEVAQRPSRRARPPGAMRPPEAARPTEVEARPAGGWRRTALPFGPWILAGSWLGIAVGEPLGTAYWRFTGL